MVARSAIPAEPCTALTRVGCPWMHLGSICTWTSRGLPGARPDNSCPLAPLAPVSGSGLQLLLLGHRNSYEDVRRRLT